MPWFQWRGETASPSLGPSLSLLSRWRAALCWDSVRLTEETVLCVLQSLSLRSGASSWEPSGSPTQRRLLGSLKISSEPGWGIDVGPSRLPVSLAADGEPLSRRFLRPSQNRLVCSALPSPAAPHPTGISRPMRREPRLSLGPLSPTQLCLFASYVRQPPHCLCWLLEG